MGNTNINGICNDYQQLFNTLQSLYTWYSCQVYPVTVYYIVTGCMGEYWTAGWKPYTSKPANPSVHIYIHTLT